MPRAEWSLQLERLERTLDPARRFADVGIQFEVYACSCGRDHVPPSSDLETVKRHLLGLRGMRHRPSPVRLLPEVYGGRYDTLRRRYVGPCDPTKVRRISVHEGQADLINRRTEGLLRLYALGTPGFGKSFFSERYGLRLAIERPNSTGGIVVPTSKPKARVWKEFETLLRTNGFLRKPRWSLSQFELVNDSIVYVLAAKSAGADAGSPLQGYSLDWVVADESGSMDEEAHDELVARGRNAGKKYFIMETAANQGGPSARLRRKLLSKDKRTAMVACHGFRNPWVKPSWWWRLLSQYSERKYRQFILNEDASPERLQYNDFSFDRNLRCRAKLDGQWADVTHRVVEELTGISGVRWVIGQDFGVLVNASIFHKCLRSPQGQRTWWACAEITTWRQTADVHARLLLQQYPNKEELLVVADPHFNTHEVSKSDYHLFAREGLRIIPSVHAKLPIKDRVSMMNVLMREGRYFVDCDEHGRPSCPKLVGAYVTLEVPESGRLEAVKKDATDQTHWPVASGYGITPFEKIRGSGYGPFPIG